MQERLYRSMARQRFASVILAPFAAFALLLAARPANILGLVIGQGMELAVAGILVGLAGAATLTRVKVASGAD